VGSDGGVGMKVNLARTKTKPSRSGVRSWGPQGGGGPDSGGQEVTGEKTAPGRYPPSSTRPLARVQPKDHFKGGRIVPNSRGADSSLVHIHPKGKHAKSNRPRGHSGEG